MPRIANATEGIPPGHDAARARSLACPPPFLLAPQQQVVGMGRDPAGAHAMEEEPGPRLAVQEHVLGVRGPAFGDGSENGI